MPLILVAAFPSAASKIAIACIAIKLVTVTTAYYQIKKR